MKSERKISVAVNCFIGITVLIAVMDMMTGASESDALALKGIPALRFFTVDSNILMMLAAILFAACETRRDRGLIQEIPRYMYIIKLVSTVSVALTMCVTVFFLGPTASGGYFSMFRGANLFLHLIVPIAAIAVFVFFEATDCLSFKDTLWSLVPTAVYALAYAINVFAHAENGEVSMKYDWYGFVQKGVDRAAIPVAAMLLSSFAISTLLWYFNRRRCKAAPAAGEKITGE